MSYYQEGEVRDEFADFFFITKTANSPNGHLTVIFSPNGRSAEMRIGGEDLIFQ